MRYKHDGNVECLELDAEIVPQLGPQTGVERGQGFVEQEQAWLGD